MTLLNLSPPQFQATSPSVALAAKICQNNLVLLAIALILSVTFLLSREIVQSPSLISLRSILNNQPRWIPDAPVRNCSLNGATFGCDSSFWTTTYAAFARSRGSDGNVSLWTEWVEEHNHERRQPRIIMKLVLITKDEWPLIKSWTFYHGQMFGFDKLYVIDSSSDSRCIPFLRYARDYLSVNVVFSTSNLNQIEGDMNHVMAQLSEDSDMMMKLDTDEFIAVLPRTEPCLHVVTGESRPECQLTPYGVNIYIQENLAEKLDGSMLKVGYTSHSQPDRELCNVPSHERETSFIGDFPMTNVSTTGFKTFFDARTFKSVDLGSHEGMAWHPFDNSEHSYLSTLIGIIHVHSTCFEREASNNEKAMISHGYIFQEDSVEIRIEKIHNLLSMEDKPCNRTERECCDQHFVQQRGCLSCHKAYGYFLYLCFPAKLANIFYGNATHIERQASDFKNYLADAAAPYETGMVRYLDY